jgi:hypothetical protein
MNGHKAGNFPDLMHEGKDPDVEEASVSGSLL